MSSLCPLSRILVGNVLERSRYVVPPFSLILPTGRASIDNIQCHTIARWGFDSILETAAALVGDGATGSDLPAFLTNSTNFVIEQTTVFVRCSSVSSSRLTSFYLRSSWFLNSGTRSRHL